VFHQHGVKRMSSPFLLTNKPIYHHVISIIEKASIEIEDNDISMDDMITLIIKDDSFLNESDGVEAAFKLS
jgi:hypothetical protein